MKNLTKKEILEFKQQIYQFYKSNKRTFAWRDDITPYKIVVSEIMLQQTQTSRVIPKFYAWIERFPNFTSLAKASNQEVLQYWQGLGYNRRGLALLNIAQTVCAQFNNQLPQCPKTLQTFPAIGPNTAGSINAFAFNNPIVFIETNIRTVFTHHFFPQQANIDDKQLLPLIEQTLDRKDPRNWYYALMDYGVHLKKKLPRINAASKHYTRQSKFEGSKRQIRGIVIKILTEQHTLHQQELLDIIAFQLPHNTNDPLKILETMKKEKIIFYKNDLFSLEQL